MTNIRKIVLANNQIYHLFNRAIDRQTIFTTKWEYKRALETLKYYHFANLPFKFSQFLNLPEDDRQKMVLELNKKNEKIVEFIAFCIMPNHFHFLVKQLKPNGISKFMSDFTNSYTRYFNTKHERKGHLFEGLFKAVLVESDEQLVHLSRYIHLNPVTSFIIKQEELERYNWSSLPEYLELSDEGLCNKDLVMNMFLSVNDYRKFVIDHIKYAQELDKVKHLTFEI